MNELFSKLLHSGLQSFLLEAWNHELPIEKLVEELLCETSSSAGSCEKCLSCKWVEAKAHPDWLKASGSIKMDELRELLYDFRLKPARSPYRIISFIDFQDASPAVQNALLKTLEEPFEKRLILLGTKQARATLPTILSRCVRIPVGVKQSTGLSTKLLEIFTLIETRQDIEIFKKSEDLLKNRENARDALMQMSLWASDHAWPGRWLELAPHLEEAIEALDRNLNPKIVFDKLLAEA